MHYDAIAISGNVKQMFATQSRVNIKSPTKDMGYNGAYTHVRHVTLITRKLHHNCTLLVNRLKLYPL